MNIDKFLGALLASYEAPSTLLAAATKKPSFDGLFFGCEGRLLDKFRAAMAIHARDVFFMPKVQHLMGATTLLVLDKNSRTPCGNFLDPLLYQLFEGNPIWDLILKYSTKKFENLYREPVY